MFNQVGSTNGGLLRSKGGGGEGFRRVLEGFWRVKGVGRSGKERDRGGGFNQKRFRMADFPHFI